MTNQHPITPPSELVRQWMERTEYDEHTWFYESYIAEQAAQYGADQELEACIEWLEQNQGRWEIPMALREARRPKPPSLKEQALEQLACIQTDLNKFGMGISTNTIRRALEALPND